MKNLSDFSPAETLLLLEGRDAQLKDLLKVTLMDLLLKQVLQTTEITQQPHPDNKDTTFTYVVRGNNFTSYRPLVHEDVFLSPFLRDEKGQMLFSNCVRIGHENARHQSHFGGLVLRNEAMRDYFEQGFSKLLKGKFSLTEKGKRMAQELRAELKELETTLPQWMETDKAKALETLKIIKGNIFLIKTIDFKMMQEIELLAVEEEKNMAYSSTTTSSTPDVFTWLVISSYMHDFDHSYNDNHWGDGGGGDGGWNSDGDNSSSGDSDGGGDSGCGGGCGGGGD